MPEAARFRVATATSVAMHLVLLLIIGVLGARTEIAARVLEPIEVSLEKAPATRPVPEMRVTVPPQPPNVRPAMTRMPGGGSPGGKAKRNPSPITPERPQSVKPASNAGGRAKAAPAPPNVLTAKTGRTTSGPVGKGSAPSGPGGQEEVAGEGPSYGAGTGGGPDPIYPKGALDRGLEGTVTVTVTVGTKGEVQAATVTSSSGEPTLDQAAVRAVKRWTFTPAMEKGKPAGGTVKVTFAFVGRAVTRR